MYNVKRKFIKGTAAFLAAITVINLSSPSMIVNANKDYNYSNPIYSEGTEDTFVYESNDKVITTKTGIKRTLPKVSGKYARDQYPIPLVNVVPSKEVFEQIKAENKELMDQVETDIANGTLTKHVAADGQFYGSISNEVTGVEKRVYVNTNAKGTHSLASYVPAGEVATVVLSEDALSYVKKGWIKLSVGTTMNEATEYEYNNAEHNRMPYLGKNFSVTGLETKVGTPFGGMLFIEINENVPSGVQIVADIKGVVDTPYYDLGQTTSNEWSVAKEAPGLYAEIRTPYLRFMVPSYFIREIENPYKACLFWNNATAYSATIMGQEERTTPMTLLFDEYITAGVAYAMVGAWYCVLPNDWATNALNYDEVIKSGSWGLIHEIDHHYQGRTLSWVDEWGLGEEFGEVTNNALNTISYILYTNIASYRGEEGLDDWNKVADPYSSLKQQIFEGKAYYEGVPNMGNFMYSTFAHEIGPITFGDVIKSTYEGATFNGVTIPAYDYQAEADGKKTRNERYDDIAYRICAASGRDYTWYMQEELRWPLTDGMVKKIKALGFEQVIPVQSVYGMGEVGRETGRPFYVPATGYTFNFEESLVSPGKTTVTNVSNPKYGTLKKQEDGTYAYTPSSSMPDGQRDEFVLTVLVEADGIKRETKLNCTIGLLYNSVKVDHYAITKWDVYDALEALKTSSPYKTTSSDGMKIVTDDGNNLAKSTGYFKVSEAGEYTFQAYGDDRAVFELQKEDKTTLQSLTVDYTATVEDAYKQQGATHFTVSLEANTPYAYTLISNNNGGSGWADVKIRKSEDNASWKEISSVCSDLADFGKSSDRSFKVSDPIYVRPSKVAASDSKILNGVTVMSTPQGVEQNEDTNSRNEGNPNNIVDGDVSTYFHSTYIEEDKTPMPHDYIFDLGSEQSFNQIDILYRRSGDDCGVIGDYEIYVADEYNADATSWRLITKDDTRQGNTNAPNDIKKAVDNTSARYVMIRVLNNRGDYDLSIIAEVTFSIHSTVANVIAQNSSYIQYDGSWSKDTLGAYVNGATYNTTNGYFMYCFEGNESNIYVTKDVNAQVRVDGGEWKDVRLTGSLREPSFTVKAEKAGRHSVEVRATGQEVALNMISTDGSFYKGEVESPANTITMNGLEKIELPVSKVSSFDPLNGVSYQDQLGLLGLEIKVTGTLGVPSVDSSKDYKLTYTVTDPYNNTVSMDRVVTVTNYAPKFTGLNTITITEGEGKDFDFSKDVAVTDYEDGAISTFEVPTTQLNTLAAGTHTLEYKATDSDGNVTVGKRTVTVNKKVVAIPALSGLKAKVISSSEITVSWSKDSKAAGYRVYRYNASTKKYDQICNITRNTTLYYRDTKRSGGTTYQYMVQAYKGTNIVSESKVSATTKLSAAKLNKAVSTSNNVTLQWSKVNGAVGYKIYRYNTSKKRYDLVSTINKNSVVSYKDSKVAAGATYKYRIVAYKNGETSAVTDTSVTTTPATPKISKITTTSKKASIRWAKVTSASGYEIYRSTNKNKGFTKVATISNAKTVTFNNSKLKGNTTYYYKMRAYKVVNGKKIYGSYSSVKSIKVKK